MGLLGTIERHRLAATFTTFAAIGAAALTIALWPEGPALLTPQQISAACGRSAIHIQDRSEAAFGGPLSQSYATLTVPVNGDESMSDLAAQYFPYAPQSGLTSLEAANPTVPESGHIPKNTRITVNLSNVDREYLPASQTLSDFSTTHNIPLDTLECLNGVAGDVHLGEDSRIITPRQSSGENWMDVHVLQAGETYDKIAQGGKYETSPASVPPADLRPGDSIFINTLTGYDRFMQPQEAIRQPNNELALEFYRTHAAAAQRIEAEFGISHIFLLGQAYHESLTPYGLSEAATKAHNLFGQKPAGPWQKAVTLQTWEHLPDNASVKALKNSDPAAFVSTEPDLKGGYKVTIKAQFIEFASDEESFSSVAKLFQTVYPDAMPYRADPYRFLAAIVDKHGARYATDPAYVTSVALNIDQMKAAETNELPSAYTAAQAHDR